jgi:hypothetical protein
MAALAGNRQLSEEYTSRCTVFNKSLEIQTCGAGLTNQAVFTKACGSVMVLPTRPTSMIWSWIKRGRSRICKGWRVCGRVRCRALRYGETGVDFARASARMVADMQENGPGGPGSDLQRSTALPHGGFRPRDTKASSAPPLIHFAAFAAYELSP